MRASILIFLGGSIAAVGAWLLVNIINDLAATNPPQNATSIKAEEPAQRQLSAAQQGRGEQPAPLPQPIEGKDAARASAEKPNRTGVGAGGERRPTRPYLSNRSASRSAGSAPTQVVDLPEVLGPLPAAFIREPSDNEEFPDIRLSDATWKPSRIGDTVALEVKMDARDESNHARFQFSVNDENREELNLTVEIENQGFFAEGKDLQVSGVVFRRREQEEIPLPFDVFYSVEGNIIDVIFSRELFSSISKQAQWLDIQIQQDDHEYSITFMMHAEVGSMLSLI